MQQLMITMMAVLGMIAPVMARTLERVLATPRVRKLSTHLLVTLAQTGRVAPQAVAANSAQAVRPLRPLTPAGACHVPPALYWRERDVDKPRRLLQRMPLG